MKNFNEKFLENVDFFENYSKNEVIKKFTELLASHEDLVADYNDLKCEYSDMEDSFIEYQHKNGVY